MLKEETLKVVINGQEVESSFGKTILECARDSGVDIPTLCFDSRVKASAACRLCSVNVKGRRLPVAACAQKMEPGMEITTDSSDLESMRKTILDLVVSENPTGECVRCEEIGPCELHTLTKRYGSKPGRFHGALSGETSKDTNPFIFRDYSQCILCYRCTSVCGEVEQAHAIVPAGRGFGSRIAAAFDSGLLDSSCTFCGQCIQTCPTGALMDRKMLGQAKASEVTKVKTVCPYCGTGCGLNLHVANNKVIGTTPDWDSPSGEGSLCVKGQFATDFVSHKDRLKTPLIRRNGVLTEATWDEAYDLIVEKFTQIKEESGPNAFTFWTSARATTESNYIMQKFARAVIGTNNVDNCSRT